MGTPWEMANLIARSKDSNSKTGVVGKAVQQLAFARQSVLNSASGGKVAFEVDR
jgi:hypothetical protein